jgi:hypothetical protein
MKNKTKEAEQKITSQIKVGVFRRLDNRFENLSDDSPRAFELHNRRKEALHEVFDGRKSVEVIDWGQTDDAQPHEFVEIVVGALAVKVFQYAVVPGLKFLGQKLAEKAVDEASGELVKTVVSWLRGPQEEKKVLDPRITLPDKTVISLDPPDRYATINILFADGKVESIKYPSLRSPRPAKHNRENVRSAALSLR